ncbi:MAG TPA: cell division protein ZapA [Candidatus Aquilonibacter sp.]|nr:cell division protein ZapA [Candidatus Aquilonibacter sp.]
MKLEIYGQAYNLSVEENEDYLKELAAYVDAKMYAVADAAHTVDTVKVAVLAALNIADELFMARSREQRLQGPLRERVEKCVSLVERAIEQSN